MNCHYSLDFVEFWETNYQAKFVDMKKVHKKYSYSFPYKALEPAPCHKAQLRFANMYHFLNRNFFYPRHPLPPPSSNYLEERNIQTMSHLIQCRGKFVCIRTPKKRNNFQVILLLSCNIKSCLAKTHR